MLATAVSIVVSLAILVVALIVIEALRRRGFDPVGSGAAFLSPDASTAPSREGV